MHILIVDDNQDDLDYYENLLKSSSETQYVIYTSKDALTGISICKSKKIDCAFIDYNLIESDGLELMKELHKIESNLPIIMLTGEPHQKIQAEAARKGAFDYLIKNMANTTSQIEGVINKVINWQNSEGDKLLEK